MQRRVSVHRLGECRMLSLTLKFRNISFVFFIEYFQMQFQCSLACCVLHNVVWYSSEVLCLSHSLVAVVRCDVVAFSFALLFLCWRAAYCSRFISSGRRCLYMGITFCCTFFVFLLWFYHQNRYTCSTSPPSGNQVDGLPLVAHDS